MSEWKKVMLGDVASFIRGINFKPDDVVSIGTPNSVVCMRTKNVQAELDIIDIWAVDESFVRREEQFLRVGDILVSSANSWNLVGKCCWIPCLPWRVSFGGFVSVLRACEADIDARFLFHWFSSNRVQTTVRSFGQQTTNISNLNINRCLALSIPLPPLPEQKRIAAILDKAEDLRAKRRESLAQLETLPRSIFLEMFGDPVKNERGWEVVRLEDIIADGPQNGLYKPASAYGLGTPIVRIDAFYDGVVTKLSTLRRLKVSTDEQKLYQLFPGDIVINRVNSLEYLGKSALIPNLSEPTVFESNMMRIRINETTTDPNFLVAFLQTDFIKGQILKASKNAVNQSSINQQDVKGFAINLPPLSLQQEFARRVAAVERVKEMHRASLNELDTLFLSLQQRAFSGEL